MRADSLIARADETVQQFYERCLLELKLMPLEVVIPKHLNQEHEKLTKRYRALKKADFRFSFDKLTASEAALILPLFRLVVRTVQNRVR